MSKSYPVLDMSLHAELLVMRINLLLDRRDIDDQLALDVSRAYSIRHRQRYGLRRVCKAWDFSPASIRRRRSRPPEKRGPKPSVDDGTLVTKLWGLVRDSPFRQEGYRKLWARLRRAGIHVSPERVRSLVREHIRPPATGIGIIVPVVDAVWGIDSTSVYTTADRSLTIHLVIDHFSAACLAMQVSMVECAEAYIAALEVALDKRIPMVPLIQLRHDSHPAFREQRFLRFAAKQGFELRRSLPGVPQCNGCAERFVRTLREEVLLGGQFDGYHDLIPALERFRTLYNSQWLITRADFQTPEEIRRASSTLILAEPLTR